MTAAAQQASADRAQAAPYEEHESAAALIVALRGYIASRSSDVSDHLTITHLAEQLQRAARSLGAIVGLPFTVLLAPCSAWVAGHFLRAPRWVHDAAEEVRIRLLQCGISELLVHGEPSEQDLNELASALSRETIDPGRSNGMLRWRPVRELALIRGLDLEDLDPDQTFETVYGWSVSSLQRLLADLLGPAVGTELRARQIARALISLPDTKLAALVHSDSVRARLSDPAERAIGRTILAIAMLRRLTSEPWVLLEVAIASILLDAIAQVATPTTPHEPFHPAVATRALQAMSRTDEGSVLRSVVVYEALWLEHQAELPALYFGRRPASLPASIVFAAHQCFARSDGSIRQAIERLQHNATSERDRWVVRLLCSTTGQSLHEGPAHTDPTPEPSRIEESKPRQEPEGAAPAQMHADAFSDEDMAGILADLGGLGALPAKRPSLSGSNQSAVACRNPVPQATSDDCIAHAVVKPSDAPRKPSSPPSIVQGSQVHESERASKAERAFDAAEAAYALGDSEEALTYADTAVMFMPQMPAYLALQTYLEAIQSVKSASLFESLNDRIDKAFAGTSPDARAYFYRGMLLRWGGKSFASKQAFRKGLELSPEDPDLLNALAER